MKKQIIALALVTYGLLVVEAAAQRGYSAGNFFLSLDGGKPGLIKSVEGGAVSAEVIEAPAALGRESDKSLGRLRYESFDVQFGPSGMDGAMADWIAQSWNRNPARRHGVLIAADHQYKEKSKREFRDAAITETTFPACDGASNDPGYIKVTLAPEITRSSKGTGKPVGDIGGPGHIRWLPGDFRLKIDGLDCSRILRIEPFTVKTAFKQEAAGEVRDPFKEPGKIDFPNLKITLNAVSAKSWQDWFQDFVLGGVEGAGGERRGTLEFLSQDRRQVLMTIEFTGLGIFRLEEFQDRNEAVSRMTVGLYCEKMALVLP